MVKMADERREVTSPNSAESSDSSDPDSDEFDDQLDMTEDMVASKKALTRPHKSMPRIHNGPGRPRNPPFFTRDGSKRHKCGLCGKSFAITRVLETHKMIEHNIEAAWKCAECGMQFLHSKSYSLHVSTRHNLNPYPCKECPEGFASRHELRAHKKIHVAKTEKPTYKCEQCPAEYPHLSKLRYHQRIHTGERPFNCNICHLAFATSSQRLNHINRSHRGIRRHLCDHCGKKFCGPRELKEHYRTHTGERPYVCQVCSRAFAKRNALVVHLRQHTGEKPYVCDQCGQAFTVRVSLRTHLKNKHNIPDISAAANKPIPASRMNQGDNSIPPIGRPKRNPLMTEASTGKTHPRNVDSTAGVKMASSSGQPPANISILSSTLHPSPLEQSLTDEHDGHREAVVHQSGYLPAQPTSYNARDIQSPDANAPSRDQSPYSATGQPVYSYASALMHAAQNCQAQNPEGGRVEQRYLDHRSTVYHPGETVSPNPVSYGFTAFPPKY